MRRVHEITLLMGSALLAVLILRPPLLPYAPHVYFPIATLLFALSVAAAITLTLRPRAAALDLRSTLTYILSVAGLAFMTMAGVNDLWLPLTYPLRFVLFLSVIWLLFVIPWIASEYRVLRRSPLAFDAALPPFLALGLYQLDPSNFDLSIFWDDQFWLALGLPAIVITYFVMCARLRNELSTFVPLVISTALIYITLRLSMAVAVLGCYVPQLNFKP